MLALVQRVNKAQVSVEDKLLGEIGKGYLIFLAVFSGDSQKDLDYLIKKVANLRIMADDNGKMNLSLTQAKGKALVVSQFTLAGDVSKGNRPSFIKAADPKIGKDFYLQFIKGLKAFGIKVESGNFGDYMQVNLVNDGPTTLIIDSKKK